ncbi:MAG: hypothetical protein JO199_14875 [Candidatus Eremiobacteraeota bacterium]|nr:hypothetical protein [Candidatus Eremiobacteraeota bacterium]
MPGTYVARIVLNGRTFEQRFVVKPDPDATETLAQMQRSYDAFAKINDLYSSVDTMLNNLDTVGKALAATHAAPGSAAEAVLARAARERSAVQAKLTANFTNGEDSVSRAGSLRENLDFALTSLDSFPVQGIVTPAAAEFYARLDAEYRDARTAYDAYATAIPQYDAALKAAGLQPLPTIPRL